MGFQSITRAPRARRVLAVAAVVAVGVGIVIAARSGLGPQRAAGDGWEVTRSVEPVADSLGQAHALADLPARSRTSDRPDSTLDSIIRIRLRPLLAGGAVPARLLASIAWDDEEIHNPLNPAAPDEHGVVTFYMQRGETEDRAGRIMIATSTGTLAAVGEGRLLFGVRKEQVGSARLTAVDRSTAEATIDLGEVALALPAHLGTLRFSTVRTDAYTVVVDLEGGALPVVSFRASRSMRTHRGVEPGDRELRFSTFADPTSWSVVVPGPDGCKPFRHTGKPGDVVDVVFADRRGIRGAIDLVKYPRAARVVIQSTELALVASPLGVSEYKAHEADAKRLIILPLPGRRAGAVVYPLGHVALADGSYWIELWSLRGNGGTRERLAFKRAIVAGGTVEVQL